MLGLGDARGSDVLFEANHCRALVFLGGVGIAHDHIDFRVSEHRRQSHKVNPGLRCASRPCMAKVVEAEP
jgi:hypothetical protein